MAGKTLVPTMLKEATDLSRHITEFQAFKAGLFTDNPELIAKAAECGACLIEFIQQLSAAREYGD